MTFIANVYAIARNVWGRPTLQHKLLDGLATRTACGVDMTDWSISYQDKPIEAVLCKHPACRS